MTVLSRLVLRWEGFLVLVLVATLIEGTQVSKYFATSSNISIALAGITPVAIIALPMTLLRHGPAMLATGMDMVGRLHLTQVFVTAVLFTGLATAGALADQARLRRLALGRDRAARAARVRARDAERLAGVGLHEVPQDLRERRVRSA